jgi:hypothetical protein
MPKVGLFKGKQRRISVDSIYALAIVRADLSIFCASSLGDSDGEETDASDAKALATAACAHGGMMSGPFQNAELEASAATTQ